MSKIKINRNDSNRILLTELLPYEVPMLFSNDGFYAIIAANKHTHFFDKVNVSKQPYGIPFNYDIAKSVEHETRTLSIIHPINQYDFIEFYKQYDSIIIHLCSKSQFSLRRVTRVAKFCYSPDLVFEEDEHQNAEAEVEPDVFDTETKVFRSYFTYHPIDLIYKFYDKTDYQRLEQRFNFQLEFDISKCFYHIYTHSITWAVKDKESAKKNARKETFENTFDKLMQLSNYNETNGIVVGPEISRIFAEIILQQIDLNVLNKLTAFGLKIGLDYEIRRYIDDFFVFSNDEKTLDNILKIYIKELEAYKLYINPSKTEKRKIPFLTKMTVGKRQIRKCTNDLIDTLVETENIIVDGKSKKARKIKLLLRPYSISQYFIKEFQCIAKQNDLTYDVLTKDVVRTLKKELVSILKDRNIHLGVFEFESFLLAFLDITFYIYSLNINASTTFKIAQIIVLITKYCSGKKEDFKQSIFSKISKESDFVMTIHHRKAKVKETNLEVLNLLIPLKNLGESHLLSEKKIRDFFNIEKVIGETPAKEVERFCKLNYFQIIVLLYYFDNHTSFERIKKILEKSVVKKFELEEDPFTKSEFTCLFFDFICCPFVTVESKRKVMRHSNYEKNNVDVEITSIQEQNMWFMNWNSNIDLEKILKKKEWSSSY